jgi:adenylate kinase family enzyme
LLGRPVGGTEKPPGGDPDRLAVREMLDHRTTCRRKTLSVERVAVVGSGGAGKTTFAEVLGDHTELPVVHLDQLHWRPGWVETPKDEWTQIVRDEASKDRWIIDGNYAGTYEIRFERADTIVILSPGRARCLIRALRRAFRHRGRPVQAEGCPERLDLHFLRWIWRYPSVSRPQLDSAIAQSGRSAHVFELRSDREVQGFLDRVTGSRSGS